MTFLVTNTSPQTKTQKHCFWWNHIAGPMLRNVVPDCLRSIGTVCQHMAAADFQFIQQFDCVEGIMVISSRQKECHRIAKAVHYRV